MNLAATLQYLIQQLHTVAGISNVYEALPISFSPTGLVEYFTTNIQGWEVANVAGVQDDGTTGNIEQWTDTIRIDGWLKYKDATTKQQMQQSIDAIKTLFRRDHTLGNTVQRTTPLRLIFSQADLFYNILCHHCRFELGVITMIA